MPRDDISRERDRAWYGDPTRRSICENCGHSTIRDSHTYFNIGFDAGARWAIRRTAQLSPVISQFVELITWLFAGDIDKIIDSKTGEVLRESNSDGSN